ncbi:SPOR domain-containing protein [Confluentibacter sediminis]|uniref:SPOR domain-containing protein n=1 Tax=Confluentibacter sediminis TaxID=2219045 RepID=UPI000DAD95AF|nr:SPOR domain-containing protein [Confluentibacter sediminis]
MKTKNLLIILLFIISIDGIAQSLVLKTVENYSFNLAFGVNLIDNSNEGPIPFDVDRWDFNTPFFITAERSFTDNWTASLTLSSNKILLNGETTKYYYSADVLANLYLDKLLFDNEDFNVYLGLGGGVYNINHITKTNFDLTAGFRYWISPRVGVLINMIGKVNKTSVEGIGNHYQLNTGLVWRIKGINPIAKRKTNLFEKNVVSRLESIEDMLKSEAETNKESIDRELKNQKALSKIKDSINTSIKVSQIEIIQKIEEIELKQNKIIDSINKKNNKKERVYTLENPDDSSIIEKGYYVIVHVLKNKDNVDKLEKYLTQRNIPFQIFKEHRTGRYYVSAGYFKTLRETLDFRNTKLNTDVFKDSWIFMQK